MANYGTSGARRRVKNQPRHSEHNAKGTEKNPYSKRETKAELLERMKAAAEARRKDTSDE